MSERLRALARALRRAIALWVVALLVPFYLEAFWLQTGLFAMAAVIGAIGLTILTGTTGPALARARVLRRGRRVRLLLLRRRRGRSASSAASGLGLPPLIAMVLAVALAGLAGALFSPISGRLRGIYLGIASIGLVFIGQHILFNATGLTGGFNGRDAEPFSLAGFSFSADDPELTIAGVPFEEIERLWYLGPRCSSRSRTSSRASSSTAGRAARWRPCATARSPPRSWASTSRATRRRRSPCRRCTPAWPACCSR